MHDKPYNLLVNRMYSLRLIITELPPFLKILIGQLLHFRKLAMPLVRGPHCIQEVEQGPDGLWSVSAQFASVVCTSDNKVGIVLKNDSVL